MYIGQTKKTIAERFSNHTAAAKNKCNRYLYDAMNHYGYDNFIIEIIEDNIQKENIDAREIYWIATLNTIAPFGYNMTKGGGGGYTLESWDEDRKKRLYKQQADKRRGQRPPEWVESIRKAAKKREQGKTTEQKLSTAHSISTTLKQKYAAGEIIAVLPEVKYGKDNWNYTEINVEEVLNLIKLQWKMCEISKKLSTTKSTVGTKLKAATGKTFTEWRREYGIKGSFGKIQRIDPDQ
jgi:group I intron endonuclease